MLLRIKTELSGNGTICKLRRIIALIEFTRGGVVHCLEKAERGKTYLRLGLL